MTSDTSDISNSLMLETQTSNLPNVQLYYIFILTVIIEFLNIFFVFFVYMHLAALLLVQLLFYEKLLKQTYCFSVVCIYNIFF